MTTIVGYDELAEGFELHLFGADGSNWCLYGAENLDKPYRMMEGEVPELYSSPFEATYKPQVGRGGSSFRGFRDLPAFITLRVDFIGDDWSQHLGLFRRALRPDADAFIEIRTVQSGARRVAVRAYEADRLLNPHDPHRTRSAKVEFNLIAPQPYWTGSRPLTAEWTASPGKITGSVVIDNPGDIPVWPRWALTAPAGWMLPDVDLEAPPSDAKPRMVEIPWLPYGRDTLIDTDPLALTAETLDGTLSTLAGLRGAHFINPIPAHSTDVELPVAIDPLPALELAIPDEWKAWIAIKLQEIAEAVGLAQWTAMTPTQVGNRVREIITAAKPAWLPDLSDGLIAELTAQAIADLWATQYGRWGVIDGSVAQIRVYPSWRNPW